MISLDSFSGYGRFAEKNIALRQFSMDGEEDFKKDLKLVQDFTTGILPKLLTDIFFFFDSGAQVPIHSDRKHFGRCFDLTDDEYEDGKKLDYDDCSIILESEKEFPDNKTSFKLSDFKYYTIRLESDGNFSEAPRQIFIRGALNDEGKYEPENIEQFSYTRFDPSDGIEDGIVLYTSDKDTIARSYGKMLPENQEIDGGVFIMDVDRPFAKLPADTNSKQVIMFRNGYALRTV